MDKLLTVKILVSICFVILSFEASSKLPDPRIKSGVSRLSGSIQKEAALSLSIHYPITAETETFYIEPDNKGHFSIDVPVETDYAIAFLNIKGDIILLGLSCGKETILDIKYDENGDIGVLVSSDFPLTSYDMLNSAAVMNDMIIGNHPYRERAPEERLYEKGQDYYVQYSLKMIKHRQEIADTDSCLSESAKQILKNEIKLFIVNNGLFNYEEMMRINFVNTNPPDNKDNYIAPSCPDKSYYAFLKEINLNDLTLLYSSEYSKFLQKILGNETLAIPRIRDMPVRDWLKTTKTIMADLTGFDDGLYYDILAANSYARQFVNELKPLSDKQIENIKDYYKGGEIEKILLRKNEQVLKLAEEKGAVVVNDVPEVPSGGEQLMNAVISKYMGKTIVVDLWATWCAPCIQAMKESRKIKKELMGRDVVFVYITNPSSPKKLWEEQINGIGGEHYYLNGDEWESVMYSLGLEGIPSYLIYDASGKLMHKFTGYQGNDLMLKMITDLLK